MALPPTYYDFVRKLRPSLFENREQDAADLLSGPNPSQAIYSVDNYNSRFPQYIERLNAEILGYGTDHPGISAEEMSPFLSSAAPQAKACLASFYGTVNYEYHSVVNFALAGKKTFHFSDNLAEHLANTEINLKAALIQLPFPTCLFTFTSRAAINAMHNIRGDSGVMQINVKNLPMLNLSVEQVFDPCTNITAGAQILQNFYLKSAKSSGQGQASLHRAISAYKYGQF